MTARWQNVFQDRIMTQISSQTVFLIWIQLGLLIRIQSSTLDSDPDSTKSLHPDPHMDLNYSAHIRSHPLQLLHSICSNLHRDCRAEIWTRAYRTDTYAVFVAFQFRLGKSSGSGSGLGSIQYLAQFSNNKKITKSCLFCFQYQKHHYLPETWPLIYDYWTVWLHFILDPDPKSGSGSDSNKATSYVSCGSGSTTLPLWLS